jgi:hypothetical protein
MKALLPVIHRARPRGEGSRSSSREHPRIESLEARQLLSWGKVPPATIPMPPTAVAVVLNSLDEARRLPYINSGHPGGF